MNELLKVALIFLSGALCTIIVGGAAAYYLTRIIATGSIHTATSKTAGVPHNPEEHARQEMMASSMERAVRIQLEQAKADGIHMTRKQAEEIARQMFRDSGMLGGAS